MKNLKRYAAPLAVFGLLVAGATGLTFVNKSQAEGVQNTANQTAKIHMMGRTVSGTVASVSGNSITLTAKNNITYIVDASSSQITKMVNGTKTTITVAQIVAGDSLRVFGTVTGTNVAAKTIVDGGIPVKKSASTTGTVATISNNTITLTSNGTTFAVDASNAVIMIVKPAGTSLTNSGVGVGDSVTVVGTTTGTNIVATKILDGKNSMGKGFGMMGK